MRPEGVDVMKTKFLIASVLAVFLLTPTAPASADIVLTPYVGSLFGGDLDDNSGPAFGATAAFMGGGIFGAEIGFNYTPEFVSARINSPEISQASFMGNLIVGVPIGDSDQAGHLRPYLTGG